MKKWRGPRRCLPLWAAAFLLLDVAAVARAHWMRPEDIVAGLANDLQLQKQFGVVAVQRLPALPRLLVIKVRRSQWDAAPREARIKLAEEWLETWRHNVPEGIVAVLDVETEQSMVNFDGLGQAQLPAGSPGPTPLPDPTRHVPG